MKVLTNKIRCNLCGEEVESTAQHDYVKCGCGACAVDGGRAYLRRTFRERGCYTELSLVEEAARMRFGTKVTINGNEKRGRITLHYASAEDLERIYEFLRIREEE